MMIQFSCHVNTLKIQVSFLPFAYIKRLTNIGNYLKIVNQDMEILFDLLYYKEVQKNLSGAKKQSVECKN